MTRQFTRIKGRTMSLNYSKWYTSDCESRKAYLGNIGFTDAEDVNSIIHMPFHLLPYNIRSQLQKKLIA
jgi:hypothetical protein